MITITINGVEVTMPATARINFGLGRWNESEVEIDARSAA